MRLERTSLNSQSQVHLLDGLVFCNEPLSMLQKVAEALEYEHLLVQASREANSLVRMAYVAIFNIVQYCCQYDRLMKPFNPLLG